MKNESKVLAFSRLLLVLSFSLLFQEKVLATSPTPEINRVKIEENSKDLVSLKTELDNEVEKLSDKIDSNLKWLLLFLVGLLSASILKDLLALQSFEKSATRKIREEIRQKLLPVLVKKEVEISSKEIRNELQQSKTNNCFVEYKLINSLIELAHLEKENSIFTQALDGEQSSKEDMNNSRFFDKKINLINLYSKKIESLLQLGLEMKECGTERDQLVTKQINNSLIFILLILKNIQENNQSLLSPYRKSKIDVSKENLKVLLDGEKDFEIYDAQILPILEKMSKS